MGILGTILKTLAITWPFIKEMVIKNTSLKEAVRNNRMVTFLFVGLLVVSALCYYMGNVAVAQHNTVKSLRRELNAAEYHLDIAGGQIDSYGGQVEQLNRDKERIRLAVNWQRDEIEELNTEINALAEEHSNELAEKQDVIDNLREQISLLERKLSNPPAYTRSRIQERLERLRDQEG